MYTARFRPTSTDFVWFPKGAAVDAGTLLLVERYPATGWRYTYQSSLDRIFRAVAERGTIATSWEADLLQAVDLIPTPKAAWYFALAAQTLAPLGVVEVKHLQFVTPYDAERIAAVLRQPAGEL